MADTEDSKAGKVAVVLSGASLVTAAIALAQRKAKAATPGEIMSLDEETMQLLIAMAQTTADIEELLKRFTIPEEGEPGVINLQVAGYPLNTEKIKSIRVQIVALNRPYQLPDIKVPDGMFLQLMGWPTNAGTVYIGESAGAVVNINQVWPLLPSATVGYQVQNANELFVSGIAPPVGMGAPGDWLAITVEQRR